MLSLPGMKKTIAAMLLVPALSFGFAGCSESDQDKAGDTASKAVEEGGEAANDATSAAGDAASAATSAAADAAEEAKQAADDVNWDGYADDTQKKIDDWAAEDNCSGLNDYVTQLDPNQDGDLITYVKAKITEAGCA